MAIHRYRIKVIKKTMKMKEITKKQKWLRDKVEDRINNEGLKILRTKVRGYYCY